MGNYAFGNIIKICRLVLRFLFQMIQVCVVNETHTELFYLYFLCALKQT